MRTLQGKVAGKLIFKSWKSYFDIDKMHNVGKDYLECIIYGKLIVISL